MNFKKELQDILSHHNKTLNDILWVETKNKNDEKIEINLRNFMFSLDFDYSAGYGGVEIDENLKVVGDNWWLERHEYDGSEWWEFKQHPTKPKIKVNEYDYANERYSF